MTGDNALAYLQSLEGTVQRLAGALRVGAGRSAGPARPGARARARAREGARRLKGRLASAQGGDLAAQAVDVKGLKVLAARLDGADAKTLRDTLDKLKDKLKTAVVVLAAVDGAKVQIAAGVTADSTGRVKAGELVNFVAQQVGGKGGGKADMAMAGGTDPSRLAEALASVAGLGRGARSDGHALPRRPRSAVPGRLHRPGAGDAAIAARRGASSIARRCATPPSPTTSSGPSTTASPAT